MATDFGDISFLINKFRERGGERAFAWHGQYLTYIELADQVQRDVEWLANELGVDAGSRVVLLGDFSFRSIPLLLALIARRAITIPLTETTYTNVGDLLTEIEPHLVLDVRDAPAISSDPVVKTGNPQAESHRLFEILSERAVPGLVLFTSGSSGKPKGVVHDFSRLLTKFHNPRPGLITLNFLLFDHWGGLNTLLGCLASGTLVVFPETRTPQEICQLVEQHRIELLPATPTFLNMLLISRAYEEYDLSSLKLITYGAEPMPETTLASLKSIFPDLELRQTYGMIELGVMRAKSRSSDSLWVKLGGEGYQTRVVDGILQIKAESAMLGYLNAPSPFTDDGYLITGDSVEQDGEYFRILGRKSDLINVGGQKVYPSEVETVILEIPEVVDAVVYGETHVLTGKIVCADIIVSGEFDAAAMRQKVKRHCHSKLQPFMVPVRIAFPKEGFYTSRLKKRRDR
ncbi:long-chain fatty acid--CoA ligase [Microvirga sp. CF3016]|uniref:long-chain fatty acid--CoA ligase n=1 Tax=Microvirga sp. CF3016 TaxID=3110181 RepID=UPI002E79DF80|nr:AMP-binding protein [Microvirga sp. CF3016]MEE1610168.1 AMP-binding protein [Microvirga sp. CF3016]